MDTAREDLLQKLFEMIRGVMREVGHSLAGIEPALSPPQVRLLFTIAGRQQGFTVTELAEKTGVTPGAVTQFVDALVEKGLVSRESDPADRRIVRLKLSEAAKAHHDKLKKNYLASVTRVFGALSDEELRQLIRILEKVDITHAGHPVKLTESGPAHRPYV
jgi:DNA-binding MarR family transcriptional regulator